MAEYPENKWEQLKSKLNVRFGKVNDPNHVYTMLHKARQVKISAQAYTERLYAFANDAFAKVYKIVVESQLVGFSLMHYTMTSYT